MIHSRLARIEDCSLVYELSNDPVVRAVSFSSTEIKYDDHEVWYEAKLKDSGCLFILVFDDDELMAQVRFTGKKGGDEVEISISVAAPFRSRGLGHVVLREAKGILEREWGIVRIRALVKADNTVSNRFFLKMGFVLQAQIQNRGHDCNVYIFEPV